MICEKNVSMQVDMEVQQLESQARHGEVLTNKDGEAVSSARLWCDGRNEAEGNELTERFGTNQNV